MKPTGGCSFVCTVLDHLVLGRTKIAAGFIDQRLRAVDMATTDGAWVRARLLELLPAIADTLKTKEEQEVVLWVRL